MKRKPTLITVALLTVCTFLAGSVQAQAETVEFVRKVQTGSTLDGTLAGSSATIVVLRATGELMQVPIQAGSIGGTYPLYDAILILSKSGQSSEALPIQIATKKVISSGTRLQNVIGDAKQACVTDENVVTACAGPDAAFAYYLSTSEIVQPSNSTPLLFSTTAKVTDDSLGVITGQQDEDGFAEVVVTNKGEKPTFATLLTDEPLEPADRIVNIIELDYDAETGIALYGGFLEY